MKKRRRIIYAIEGILGSGPFDGLGKAVHASLLVDQEKFVPLFSPRLTVVRGAVVQEVERVLDVNP